MMANLFLSLRRKPESSASLRWITAFASMALLILIASSAPSFAAPGPALDSDKPIDISADELEVRQQEKQAIFSGNVVARQGNLTMQSGRMVVFYDGQGSGAKPAGPEGGTSISKIEADGGVFFTSPTETAKGRRAIYDVTKEQIRILGDVTLTRDQSVVKGSGLVYNLQTGRSVLTSNAGSGKPGERVRGLFVPGGENAQNNKQAQ
jgi:lipopolysaccharide transport periplasmic protein LptA